MQVQKTQTPEEYKQSDSAAGGNTCPDLGN
jgi:hypothetical protein